MRQKSILFFSVLLICILLSTIFSCTTHAEKGSSQLDDGSTSNSNKIDPSLLIEMERLKSAQQLNEVIEVIIRTKAEISAAERAEIERNGGKIGSVIGDIFTARIPAQAISKMVGMEFIVYIEKAKKQQLR